MKPKGFTWEDRKLPVFCTGCGEHISRKELLAGDGTCAKCLSAQRGDVPNVISDCPLCHQTSSVRSLANLFEGDSCQTLEQRLPYWRMYLAKPHFKPPTFLYTLLGLPVGSLLLGFSDGLYWETTMPGPEDLKVNRFIAVCIRFFVYAGGLASIWVLVRGWTRYSKARQSGRVPEAIAAWEQMQYCEGCDVVFEPKSSVSCAPTDAKNVFPSNFGAQGF